MERLNRKLCFLERCKLQRDEAADEGRAGCSVSVGEGNIKRKHCSGLRHQDSRELNMLCVFIRVRSVAYHIFTMISKFKTFNVNIIYHNKVISKRSSLDINELWSSSFLVNLIEQ